MIPACTRRDRWGDAQCDRYLTPLEWPACNWHKSQDYAGHTPTIRRIGVRWREGTPSSIASSRTAMLVVRILHTAMLPELHLPGQPDDEADQDE